MAIRHARRFCEKHPRTASRIEKFLDLIVVELEEGLAKSEILKDAERPMGPVISERASRPLISEADPEVRYEAIHQIVKVAEEKLMDGTPPPQRMNLVEPIDSDMGPIGPEFLSDSHQSLDSSPSPSSSDSSPAASIALIRSATVLFGYPTSRPIAARDRTPDRHKSRMA